MNQRTWLFVLLMAVMWPFGAYADGMAVKCAPNEERAWLYDSVSTLNVAAKLKCGETVQVIGTESGYVKVRTTDGTEGFLPASNLPKIPVGTQAVAPAQQPAQESLATLARAAVAARRANTESTTTNVANATSSSASAAAAQPVVAANVTTGPTPASAPKTGPNAGPVAASPAKAAVVAASVTTVSNTTATTAEPLSASAHTSTAASSSRAKAKTPAKPAASTVTTSAKPTPTSPPTPRPAANGTSNAPVHTAMVAPVAKAPSAQPVAAPVPDVYVGGMVNASATPKQATVRTVADTSDDDDDSYLTKPVSESDDPSCQTYFSGYGLSPGQFKWLVDNRKKKYPGVCPAASPSMVDYVIIFTHDVDFFNYTMPTPVHTEAGGFSDWTPMLEYDMSVVSHSDVDKSRREYVWVFHVKRGAFDPAKFSPHRKFQYNKVESKYTRTVEDAFDFIQEQGTDR